MAAEIRKGCSWSRDRPAGSRKPTRRRPLRRPRGATPEIRRAGIPAGGRNRRSRNLDPFDARAAFRAVDDLLDLRRGRRRFPNGPPAIRCPHRPRPGCMMTACNHRWIWSSRGIWLIQTLPSRKWPAAECRFPRAIRHRRDLRAVVLVSNEAGQLGLHEVAGLEDLGMHDGKRRNLGVPFQQGRDAAGQFVGEAIEFPNRMDHVTVVRVDQMRARNSCGRPDGTARRGRAGSSGRTRTDRDRG